MDRNCEYFNSCGMDFCRTEVIEAGGLECPHYLPKMKPILFNTEMSRKARDGSKTMTRRVASLPKGIEPEADGRVIYSSGDGYGDGGEFESIGAFLGYFNLSQYRVGDVLWVRETWAPMLDYVNGQPKTVYAYRASVQEYYEKSNMGTPIPGWHPSIHMPRAAARTFLRVPGLKIERLWDITEEDAIAEGFAAGMQTTPTSTRAATAKQAFMWTWQMLYNADPKKCWAVNPWVWAYTFLRCENPEVPAR